MASALLYYKKSLSTFCILIISCFLFLYQLISFITCFLLWNNIRSGILSARKWYTHLISWKSAKPRTLNRFQTNAISIQPQECTADAQESCLIIRKRQNISSVQLTNPITKLVQCKRYFDLNSACSRTLHVRGAWTETAWIIDKKPDPSDLFFLKREKAHYSKMLFGLVRKQFELQKKRLWLF